MAVIDDSEFGKVITDEPETPQIDIKKFGIENRQKHIDQYYNGNKEAYLAQKKKNNLNLIFWQELVDYEDAYPEHQERAEKLIKICLGYIPPKEGNYFHHEIQIRKLIERFNIENYSEEKHFDEVYAVVTDMRNDDMKKDNFCKTEHSERDIAAYSTYGLIPYSGIARDRLAHYLGYYPDLRYSLEAELFLRYYLADDNFNAKDKITTYDMRAITIVKYREVLLNEGQEAADKSPLVGFQRVVETTG